MSANSSVGLSSPIDSTVASNAKVGTPSSTSKDRANSVFTSGQICPLTDPELVTSNEFSAEALHNITWMNGEIHLPSSAQLDKLPMEVLALVFVSCLDAVTSTGYAIHIPCTSLPIPWILAQVCSRWRQTALAERRLWNSISFSGSMHHLPMLQAAFNRCGRMPIRFHISRLSTLTEQSLTDVVIPRFRQITRLHVTFSSWDESFWLFNIPSDLFEALKEVELCPEQTSNPKNPPLVRHLFWQDSSQLRCFGFGRRPRHSWPPTPLYPLPFQLPWYQLTSIHLIVPPVHVSVAHDVVYRCHNLRECSFGLRAYHDRQDFKLLKMLSISGMGYPDMTIKLPFLRKLNLHVGDCSPDLCRHFLQLLQLPAIEEMNFAMHAQSVFVWTPAELAAAFTPFTDTNFRLGLAYTGLGINDVDFKKTISLNLVTSLVVHNLPCFALDLLSDFQWFPRLDELEIYPMNYKSMSISIRMLEARWRAAMQCKCSGIRRAVVRVTSELSENLDLTRAIAGWTLELYGILGTLGVDDTLITVHEDGFTVVVPPGSFPPIVACSSRS